MNLKEALTNRANEAENDDEGGGYVITKPLLIRQEDFIKNMGYSFRHNVVRDTIEFTGDGKAWMDFTEYDINDICREFELNFPIQKGDRLPTDKRIDRLVKNRKMSPLFDPFKDFFETTPWDGTYRLEKLIRTVNVKDVALKSKDRNFTTLQVWPELFTRWMVAACHCGLGRGPNGVMLLLISPAQGTFKTTWLNNLVPPVLSDYSHTGHINPSLTENVTINALAEKFLMNIDDQLDTIFQKDFNALKSLITTPFVTNRKSFRRDDKKRSRRANFVGSVNNTEIFRDHQNRRYLSFEIDSINMQAARQIDISQVWAEVYNLYKGGAQHYFDKKDESIINALADHYSYVTAEEEWFSRLFVPSDQTDPEAIPYFPTEVLSIIRKASHLNVYERNLATALKKLGVNKIKKRIKGYKDPRDVYMLRENFIRQGEQVIPKGLPGEGVD